jgi:hypothetical protein
MTEQTTEARSSWDDLTWEGSRDLLLERSLQATPAQRLAWLEEMLELAWSSGALVSLRDAEADPLAR